ncbi:MAG: carboxypeptidase regulatory-like domain-containing protein [Pyrinomonadaceae bacterium]
MRILPRAAFAVVCAFLLLFSVNNSNAKSPHQTAVTRTSVSSGNWDSPSTWSGGVVPTSGNDVVIAAGTTVTVWANQNIGSGKITIESDAILDVASAEITANLLVANNGSELRQGGSYYKPRTSISVYQLAPNSTFTYYGNPSILKESHPTYGNLNFQTTADDNGTLATDLTVLGKFTIDLTNDRELQMKKNFAYSFGSIEVKRGKLSLNTSSGTPSINVNVQHDILIAPVGTLYGTTNTGHVSLNLGGDLINNGTFQQDNGSGTGVFTVNLNGTAEQHLSGLNPIAFENLTINNFTGVVLDREVAVDKVLTLTSGRVHAEDFALNAGPSSTIVGAGEDSYITGYIAKEFSSTGSFVFPVGTDSGYSPVNATITALATNPSKLTVAAFNGPGPGVEAANSVTRFWNIVEDGDLTANLTFSYRDADVTTPAAEASYSLVKKEGNAMPVVVCTGNGCVDAAANTATASGLATFSRWAIGVPVAPSSAEAMVAGRVTNADARAVKGAFLTAVGTDGRVRFALTNQFGYYRLRALTAGETYTITIYSKQYSFAPSTRVITLNDIESQLDFVAEER